MTMPRASLLKLATIYGFSAILLIVASLLWWYADDVRTLVRPENIRDGALSTKAVRYYAAAFGSMAMLDYFGRGIDDLTIGPEHRAAHIIGQVLYEREGLDAIGICGDAFTYGCLHQVMGLAATEFGVASSTALITACHDTTGVRYGTCAHSVGHGLVFSIEYERGRIEQALKICDDIQMPPVDQVQSCYAGVFMEYNMRLMLYQYPEPRELGDEPPRALCDELTDPIHRRMCVFWMIPWLHAVQYDYSYRPQTFAEMGALCQLLEEQPLRRECFMSIGRTLTISGVTDVAFAFRQCENSAKGDAEDRESCAWWAARSYFLAERAQKARELCGMLPESQIQSCVEYATTPTKTP